MPKELYLNIAVHSSWTSNKTKQLKELTEQYGQKIPMGGICLLRQVLCSTQTAMKKIVDQVFTTTEEQRYGR